MSNNARNEDEYTACTQNSIKMHLQKSIDAVQSMLQTISFKSVILPFGLYIKSKKRDHNE